MSILLSIVVLAVVVFDARYRGPVDLPRLKDDVSNLIAKLRNR